MSEKKRRTEIDAGFFYCPYIPEGFELSEEEKKELVWQEVLRIEKERDEQSES